VELDLNSASTENAIKKEEWQEENTSVREMARSISRFMNAL
jgi:HAMP domain-containing protein